MKEESRPQGLLRFRLRTRTNTPNALVVTWMQPIAAQIDSMTFYWTAKPRDAAMRIDRTDDLTSRVVVVPAREPMTAHDDATALSGADVWRARILPRASVVEQTAVARSVSIVSGFRQRPAWHEACEVGRVDPLEAP